MNENTPKYRWPDLSPVIRQYLVRDDQGRMGIATSDPVYHPGVLFARPAGVPARIGVTDEPLPANATIMTATAWHRQADGSYTGTWFDYDGPTFPAAVPPEMIRRIVIIEDLGWVFPDKWADRVLAGSDQDGHWDWGATLGRVGGEPPVRGQQPGETSIPGAVEYTREVGQPLSESAIRKAAQRGDIPGARKVGRNWLIPYDGLNHLLDNPPQRGPRRRKR